MDALVTEHHQLRGAFLAAQAFHAPPSLNDEMHAFRERAGLTLSREEATANAEATLDGLRRAQAAKAAAATKAREAARGD